MCYHAARNTPAFGLICRGFMLRPQFMLSRKLPQTFQSSGTPSHSGVMSFDLRVLSQSTHTAVRRLGDGPSNVQLASVITAACMTVCKAARYCTVICDCDQLSGCNVAAENHSPNCIITSLPFIRLASYLRLKLACLLPFLLAFQSLHLRRADSPGLQFGASSHPGCIRRAKEDQKEAVCLRVLVLFAPSSLFASTL